MPVAEHHDGFAMYDSALSRWTAAKLGPKRDIVGELARAVRARGMVFGVSNHRAEHWWFYDAGRKFDSDVNDPRYQDLYGPAEPRDTQPNQTYLDDWLARCQELVKVYQPQLFWIGPKPDRMIPEPEVEILREIGRWLAINGEAIYGTRPRKVFGEGPTEVVGGSFTDTRRPSFTSRDVRFTTKGEVVYAIVLGVPEGEVTIQSLGSNLRLYDRPIARVRQLGSNESLRFQRDESGVRVTLVSRQPAEHAVALAIEGE